MPYVALPAFITALRRKPSYGRMALELLSLTGVRSQEVRLATWAEFDLEDRLWAIPADHMKRGKAHMVPISDTAQAVLAKVNALRLPDTDIVFPGLAGKPMSDMTLLKVLRDMSEPFHVHGFRSTCIDWAANEDFPDPVVEAALAHKTPDARLSIMEMRWGLIPDMGGYALWRGTVRDDVLRELTYTNREFSGEEAGRVGFATYLDADPYARAMAIATEIATKNPDAVRAAKDLFNRTPDLDTDAILMEESVLQDAIIRTPTQVEAVFAFMQKRAANFS
jgi:hypothetical protein